MLAQAQPREVTLDPRAAGGGGDAEAQAEATSLLDVLAHAGQDGLQGDQRVAVRAVALLQRGGVERTAAERLQVLAGIEGVHGADALRPFFEGQRVAVLGIDRLPRVVHRRLGVEDEAVEVEDEQAHQVRMNGLAPSRPKG